MTTFYLLHYFPTAKEKSSYMAQYGFNIICPKSKDSPCSRFQSFFFLLAINACLSLLKLLLLLYLIALWLLIFVFESFQLTNRICTFIESHLLHKAIACWNGQKSVCMWDNQYRYPCQYLTKLWNMQLYSNLSTPLHT